VIRICISIKKLIVKNKYQYGGGGGWKRGNMKEHTRQGRKEIPTTKPDSQIVGA